MEMTKDFLDSVDKLERETYASLILDKGTSIEVNPLARVLFYNAREFIDAVLELRQIRATDAAKVLETVANLEKPVTARRQS